MDTNTMTTVRPAAATLLAGFPPHLPYDNTLLTWREREIIGKGWDGEAVLEHLPTDRDIRIAVHSGDLHADDVGAVALLNVLVPLNEGQIFTVVRTRDTDTLQHADLCIDVNEGLLDHHGKRATPGTAAITRVFQLIYNTYSTQYPKQVWQELAQVVDDIAALDCGETTINTCPWVNAAQRAARAQGLNDDAHMDALFKRLVRQMADYMGDIVVAAIAAAQAQAAAESCIEKNTANGVTVFDEASRNADVKKAMYDLKVPSFFYVSPQSPEDWRVLCAADPQAEFAFNSSWHLIPQQYRGLRGEDLAKATGCPDAIFCHQAGFIAGFGSHESAVAFAEACAKECGWTA